MTPFSSIRFGADTSGGSKPLDLSKIPVIDPAEHGHASVAAGSTFGVSFPYEEKQATYSSVKLNGGASDGFQYKNWTAKDGKQIYVFQAPRQSADFDLQFWVRDQLANKDLGPGYTQSVPIEVR